MSQRQRSNTNYLEGQIFTWLKSMSQMKERREISNWQILYQWPARNYLTHIQSPGQKAGP